ANNVYEDTIERLTELVSDLDQVLVSTRNGALFLDKRLRIRRFTPMMTKQFGLTEDHLGQPFDGVLGHFRNADLMADAMEVLKTRRRLEHELQTVSGNWYLVRVFPAFNHMEKLDGV